MQLHSPDVSGANFDKNGKNCSLQTYNCTRQCYNFSIKSIADLIFSVWGTNKITERKYRSKFSRRHFLKYLLDKQHI